MKLYSILLFQKSTVGHKPKLLKDAYDLKDFSFFQRGSVKEFMDFTGRLLIERAATPYRTSIKEQEYFIYCYVRQDNLTGVCITDGEYNDAIQNAASCSYSKLPELLAKWQNPREADSLIRVQDEIEETKVVLHNTILSVLERGEKLDDLVRASENLSEKSKMFYTQARKMNKCCSWA
uniref:Uncharacterized protein n=1 Tax=Panagrolaimus davidi TaxID=227884 RepID=A0A914QKE4_9BILA